MGDTPSLPRREALVADALSVRYPARSVPALSDVSLGVEPGSMVTFTGRTGAGKSTLALALAGFLPRVVRATVTGAIHLGDTSLVGARLGTAAGRVGIVFSTPAHQLSASKPTVREELAFGLENLGVPRSAMDPRIDQVLDHLGISALQDREPLTLSGGEQQRVAIASIVAMDTEAIVLDEPTAQLDPGGTLDVAALLIRLRDDGRVVVWAEQDASVLALGSRCLLLDRGSVQALDQPGVTLSPATLDRVGLPAPTLAIVAAAAHVDTDHAFDEAWLAHALRQAGSDLAVAEPAPSVSTADLLDLAPAREARAVAIQVEDLVHEYAGGITALRGVTLTVSPGESVAIVGQNGSGKTSLVKHMNGLLRPTAGSVRVGEEDVAGRTVSEMARIVGFVFQNPDDQLFERSVEREVEFGPKNLGLDGAQRARLVERALAAVGMLDLRATNPYDLGPSERKLVALASVLAMDPAVLVLDEPTAGQDGPGIARIGAVVRAWTATGRTAIAVTHDMEFAARTFSRVVAMRDGQVVLDGGPSTVFAPSAAATLQSTGLRPPPAARLAAMLELPDVPVDAAGLLQALGPRSRPRLA